MDGSVINSIETDYIDVPLVVGKQPNNIPSDHSERCLAAGWEYIDLADTGEEESGGEPRSHPPDKN